ncbi:MAG: hypothetical protein WCX29_03265 [Candidatus Peribacteraceae bacterium]|nr:hypothetical protein [Candidatus Peribacteria bacterium]
MSALTLSSFIPQASAQDGGLSTACKLLGGCDISGNPVVDLLGPVADLLVYLIAALAVLFVVWGGAQILMSLGDESRFTSGRNSVVYGLVGFGLALTAQVVISFVVDKADQVSGAGNPIGAAIAAAVDFMLTLMNTVFLIIMFIAGFKFVLARGSSDQVTSARKAVGFAIVGAIIINLSKSLVTAVLNLGL